MFSELVVFPYVGGTERKSLMTGEGREQIRGRPK